MGEQKTQLALYAPDPDKPDGGENRLVKKQVTADKVRCVEARGLLAAD